MSLIKFAVNGQNLYPYAKENILASDTLDFIQCQFEFSETWEGMEKTAVFTQGENMYLQLLAEDSCYVPEAVKEGYFYLSVMGVKEGSRATTRPLKLYMIKSGYSSGSIEPPPPDIYAQILQLAKEAQETAQSVRDDADEGKFDGKPGPEGPPGPAGAGVPPITERDNGKFLGVFDGKAVWLAGGAGSGNVVSPEIYTIRALDLEEYNSLEQKDKNTLYLIKG